MEFRFDAIHARNGWFTGETRSSATRTLSVTLHDNTRTSIQPGHKHILLCSVSPAPLDPYSARARQ